MPTIDQYSDAAFGLLVRQALRMPAFADFVKEAELESDEVTTLPPSAFAWPEERKLPIHTDKHAAISFAYAKAQTSIPPHVVARVKEALDVFGIPDTLFAEPEVKVAEDDGVWLLPDLKLFSVRSREDVKTAELALLAAIPRLNLEHRATACTNLVKKATELGAPLHPRTKQLAGMVVSSTKVASEWLEARAVATKRPEVKVAYQKLASEMRRHGAEVDDRETLVKIASVIAELDEKAGLAHHYDRKLPDPLLTVFNTEKEAAASVDLCGTMVPISKLAGLPATFWQDLGGPELSREIAPGGHVDPSKLATVVSTLPLDLKTVLKAQIGA